MTGFIFTVQNNGNGIPKQITRLEGFLDFMKSRIFTYQLDEIIMQIFPGHFADHRGIQVEGSRDMMPFKFLFREGVQKQFVINGIPWNGTSDYFRKDVLGIPFIDGFLKTKMDMAIKNFFRFTAFCNRSIILWTIYV